MHRVWRLLHPSQIVSPGAAKVHRVFRRLHSQQESVPFRTLRFLGAFEVSAVEQVSNRSRHWRLFWASISVHSR